MWKLSGIHGGFTDNPDAATGDVKLPFSDFVDNNASLLYTHEILFSFLDYLARITGESGTMIHFVIGMDSHILLIVIFKATCLKIFSLDLQTL